MKENIKCPNCFENLGRKLACPSCHMVADLSILDERSCENCEYGDKGKPADEILWSLFGSDTPHPCLSCMRNTEKKDNWKFNDDLVTSKNGLLWKDGKVIDAIEADRLARKYGFYCAEQLVKHLEDKNQKEN